MLDLRMSTRPEGAGPTTYEVLVRGELSDDLIADLGARAVSSHAAARP